MVYRVNESEVEVVICGRNTPPLWGLPKGTPDPGETRQQTALREVNEETGLEVEIYDYVGCVDYWFVRSFDGVRCHKTVHYYLMSATGGDVSRHDSECDCVYWMPVERALRTLTYDNEVRIVEDALSLVSKKARTG